MEKKMAKEKSNFSVTCSLLSQYLKEKGSFGDLMPPRPQEACANGIFRPPATMSLLPGAAVPGGDGQTETGDQVSDRNAAKSMDLFPRNAGFGLAVPAEKNADTKPMEIKADQLTIFYCGKVLVFNNFPAEKAKDLMQLAAGKGMATAAPATAPVVAPSAPVKPAQPNIAELQMPRKASLHRFLAKRKDRINARAPYQMNGSPAAASKPDETPAWLWLGPEARKPNLAGDSHQPEVVVEEA